MGSDDDLNPIVGIWKGIYYTVKSAIDRGFGIRIINNLYDIFARTIIVCSFAGTDIVFTLNVTMILTYLSMSLITVCRHFTVLKNPKNRF